MSAFCADCKPGTPAGRVSSEPPESNAQWWCRDCAKSLCRSCFLMNGHTEHRAGPWQRRELLQSCVEALEGRCSWRTKLAADEEISLKELVSEVEAILIATLHQRLEQMNERDRIIIAHLNNAIAEIDTQSGGSSNRDGARSPVYHLPSPSGAPAWKLWTMCEEQPERMEELIAEACKIVHLPYKPNSTRKQNGRRPSSRRSSSASSSKQLDVLLNLVPLEWTAERLAKMLVGVHKETFETVMATPPPTRSDSLTLNGTTHRRAQIASADKTGEDGSRMFPTPSPSTDFMSYGSFTHLPNGNIANTDSDVEDSTKSPRRQPLEPSVLVNSSSRQSRKQTPSDYAPSGTRSSSAMPCERISRNSECPSGASSIPPYPRDSSFDSADLSVTPTLNGGPISNGVHNNISSSDVSASSSPIKSAHQRPEMRYFGEEFLTRPIDIVALPDRKVFAVSDSCGGVYILSSDFSILHRIEIKNSSASSLAVGKREGVNVLLVSVLQSRDRRSIHIYDIDNGFRECEVIPCPREPKIDNNRTRWLTVGPRGEIFMVSGDNSRSALWLFNGRKKVWRIVHESRKTRLQYLCVAEDQADFKAVVLLTCDAAQNRLLLFVVDQMGNMINEYDLTKTYRLNLHVLNPASAIVDSRGNLLIVDYATGKLWVLLSGVKGIRRLKELNLEVGGAQALGLAALGDFVYVTCFNHRRVVGVRYMLNGVFKSGSVSSLRSPQLSRRALSVPRPNESQV